MDDGGCYYCGTHDDDRGGDVVHLSRRSDLGNACWRACDEDIGCVAFTVGREPSRSGQEYLYNGVIMNCCLERRMYPSGVYVDGSNGGNDDGRRRKDHCQLEAACWTWYEREEGGRRRTRDEESGVVAGHQSSLLSSSSLSIACVRTWDPVPYTDDEI
ncbi:hypothetical protein ACHAW5_001138 [Stephanodiscus triporus]|uniref:Apple domain-containing protein n=1 Tax=Stephanodiscus triporus TaxID=2934178 RepID=A0ABD3QQU4_9STRA